MPFFWLAHPTSNNKEAKRVSQVPDASLTACHALGPRQSLRNLTFAQCSGQALQRVCDSFVLASGTLKPSPTARCTNEAELLKGGTAPLRPTVFPVYASRSLFLGINRVRRPRNTRYGLLVRLCPMGTSCSGNSSRAPYKKHQAALGAPTICSSHPLSCFILERSSQIMSRNSAASKG